MAVSRRLRFEILRRDNHTCQYCGAKAPNVALTVDHVKPVALGGLDEPGNLVTACQDCNAGKTSTTPDEQIVASVDKAAADWSAAMVRAAEEERHSAASKEAVYEAVVKAWPSYHRNRIPKDYTETIDQFAAAGLSPEVIVKMAVNAGAKPGVWDRWGYFCGSCWNKIRKLQDRAAELLQEEASE
ncbi:HNH endonuclease [Mycolicibacterium sp.]|uniref:HNH endonuclease n=1 Tax=Mycolicibacterium sp. TaxID=2320850 RepID=UPI001A327C27|nr:HNH endonuclease [Mycolicibacterium sp.]MBJ7401548.1 HNH endonuclease [Mycolicibacterium sp.]